MKKKFVLFFLLVMVFLFGVWKYVSAQRDLRVQAEILFDAQTGLQELAKKSTRAATFLTFYERHSVHAITTAQNQVQPVSSRRNEKDFYVAAHATLLPKRSDGEMMAMAKFSCAPIPVISFQNYQTSAFVKGLILAHELSHAEDCVVLHQLDSAPGSDQFARDETKGYMASVDILHDVKGAAWDLLVEKIRAEREKGAVAAGWNPDAFAFGLIPEYVKDVWVLFPDMGETDINFLATHLELAANFANQKHHGFLHHETEAQIFVRQIKYMKSYLERVGRFY